MPEVFPVITKNKLAHLRYIYENGSFSYYNYRGHHYNNVAKNFTKATQRYLQKYGLITQIFDNYFSDIWDITAYGVLLLSHADPDFKNIDLKLLLKRVNQPYEVWIPDRGMGLFDRKRQTEESKNNVTELTRKGESS